MNSQNFETLAPLSFLSVIFWTRDRLLFNRVNKDNIFVTTHTQRTVLFVVYPLWIFLNFVLSIQLLRDDPLVYLTTFGAHVTGHLATIGIYNDTFVQSRKQFLALIVGSFVSFTWTVYQAIFAESVRVDERENIDCDRQCPRY